MAGRHHLHFETRITLAYLLFSSLWILLSDRLLFAIVSDLQVLTRLQTYKGWGFVVLSALLLYFLLRQALASERRAQAELNEANERYRLIYENSLDAILFTAPDGGIFAANPAACRMFDRTEGEICQAGRNGLIDIDDSRLPLALEERSRNGKFTGELTFLRRNGEKFPCEVSSALFTDRYGQPRTSMVIHDVSEQKQAEKALRESERRFFTIFHASPIGTNIFRLSDNRSVDVNEAYLEIVGYSRDEVVNHTAAELDLFIDEEARTQWMRRLAESGNVQSQDARVRRKSGEIRHVLASIELIEINGEKMGLVVAADITARKQAENDLAESEARYRNLLEVAPVGIAVHCDGKVVFTNPAGARLLGGKSKEQIVGKPIAEIIDPTGLEAAQKRIQRMLAGEQGLYPTEDVYRKLDGSSVNVEVMATALRYENKPAVQVIVTDITERKRIAEALGKSHEQLREITARLAEMQETERLALSKELHDQVGQGLTALSINLNLIRSRIGQDTPETLMERFDAPLELVAEITDKIRDVMAALHPPVLDDYGLAAALRWYANRLHKQTGLEVHVTGELLQPRLPLSVSISLFRIAQEALTNVVKHARTDQVYLVLQEQAGYIDLEITDRGRGFMSDRGDGDEQLHWGLATMRERAEALGGRLEVETAPDEGTKISVRIPRQMGES